MSKSANNNDMIKLYEDAQKMKKTSCSLPNCMDGLNGSSNIVNVFQDKYKNILNSVGYNVNEINDLKSDINELLNNDVYNKYVNIKFKQTMDAVKNLKLDKSEECGMFTNHLKYGPDSLIVHLTFLYNAMIKHGTSSSELVEGIMIPLIKDKRSSNQKSDNYRALTLGTILSKLFETIILQNNANIFQNSEQQFGFKIESSTTMCSFAIQETIEYYNSKDSTVFALMLDASKAFDRVAYVKLFRKLVDRGLNPYIIRFLINMYTQQNIRVKWNGVFSEPFNVTNGVRQGGIVSPLLFTLYVDGLICKLKKAGIGCYIGCYFYGILGFADDIILLCPSLDGLRKRIKICEDFAEDHSILFNGSKSKLLVFGKYDGSVDIEVNHENVPVCDNAVHLGIELNSKYEDKYEYVNIGTGKFNNQVNYFHATFKSCYSMVKQKLFMQYCGSLYGAQLWPLWHKNMINFYTQWRKALRRIWGLPSRTHCIFLPLISDTYPIELISYSRFVNFYKKLLNSDNSIVRNSARMSKFVPNSSMGRNLNYVLYKCNLDVADLLQMTGKQFKDVFMYHWNVKLNENDCQVSSVIKDVIYIRDGYYDNILDRFECDLIINNLSTQ